MLSLEDVRFELTDLNSGVIEAWDKHFSDCPNVSTRQGSILKTTCDAIVSPANSFGFMDGGLDLLLSEHFGWDLEARVRQRLLDDHDGELPVGQAVIVPTEHEHVPWLVSAPTMRVPMDVSSTAHAHLAFRAILRAVRAHNAAGPQEAITSVACPGLGTGEGKMPPERCARQMRRAYEVCARGRPLRKGGLAAAVREHMELIEYEEQ